MGYDHLIGSQCTVTIHLAASFGQSSQLAVDICEIRKFVFLLFSATTVTSLTNC